jgi:Rrf2 family protein
MISDTTKYALQILGHLAKNPNKLIPGEEIAEETGIPANYLGKILNQLGKFGFVDSQKGWGGGFSLRSGSKRRPIKDVIVIFEGADSLTVSKCAFGLAECSNSKPCPLHGYWQKIQKNYHTMIGEVKVEDLK